MSVVKKMSGAVSVSAFVALTAFAGWSCGGDDPEDNGGNDGGTSGGEDGGTGGECNGTRPARNLTLIKVLGSSASDFVNVPHMVEVVKGDGTPLSPPVTAMSDNAGKFTISGVPCEQKEAWIHVIGNGPKTADTSTYDSISLSAPDSGDDLIRISTVGTASTAEMTGGFTADQSKVAIGGAVYSVDSSGKRVGGVGCAKVYIDDLPHPALTVDQRYIQGVLPAPLSKQEKTQRSGKFYFGNVVKGEHTFKVSMDDGATFLDLRVDDEGTIAKELKVNLPYNRDDAKGEFKSFLVLFGVDVVGANPTPASCPQDE